MKIEYELVEKNILENLGLSNKYRLSEDDLVKLEIHGELFQKLLDMTILSIQTSIGEGKWTQDGKTMGDPMTGLSVVLELQKIKNKLANIGKVHDQFKQEKVVEELKKKIKAEEDKNK